MAGHSPLLYDRKYNPSAILSYREFIVCHREFSNTDAARLCVWDPFRGMKTTLPPPPIFDTIFLCDGESVYVLSPATVTEKQNVPIDVYNVWMLDLREFNLRWKKLPSLPRLGEEYNIYASICVGERYIWQRRRTLSSEADGWKLSGSGSGENDSKWLWQHIDVNTPPPQNLNFDQSNRLPLYIEMTAGTDRFPHKFYTQDIPFPGSF
jgi:hypothetical protein